jgi:hypothetical protein
MTRPSLKTGTSNLDDYRSPEDTLSAPLIPMSQFDRAINTGGQ